MSAAAGADLRSDFRDKWGFPVDDSSFDQVYPQVKRLVAQYHPTFTIYIARNGLCGDKYPCFTSAQDGIDSAQSSFIIEMTQDTYDENITLHDPKMLTLKGGWDSTFDTRPSMTTIHGSLTISSGTLAIEDIVLR